VYSGTIELVETPVFTRQVMEQFSSEEYRAFQLYLMLRPDAGAVIPASHGLRKVRWVLAGRGKRGGARIIYYRRCRQTGSTYSSSIPRTSGVT
jgi:hypothetical protein